MVHKSDIIEILAGAQTLEEIKTLHASKSFTFFALILFATNATLKGWNIYWEIMVVSALVGYRIYVIYISAAALAFYYKGSVSFKYFTEFIQSASFYLSGAIAASIMVQSILLLFTMWGLYVVHSHKNVAPEHKKLAFAVFNIRGALMRLLADAILLIELGCLYAANAASLSVVLTASAGKYLNVLFALN